MTAGRHVRAPRSADSRRATRALVLIASSDDGFGLAAAALLEGAGFRAGYTMEHEPASLTFTRTQPVAVLCDFDAPTDLVEGAVTEAVSRAVPVLLLLRGPGTEDARGHAVAPGVSCAPFPADAPAMGALLQPLIPPPAVSHGRAPRSGVTDEG